MNPASKMIYVPPRPNLGPEPLPETRSYSLVLALAVLAATLLLAWRLRRRWRTVKPPSPPAAFTLPAEGNDSPRERMIAWSVALRESLAARFGPAWRAKTTEEIARDPALLSAIGPDRTQWLVDFLAAADRAKFADSDQVGPGAEESELRALAELVADRGA